MADNVFFESYPNVYRFMDTITARPNNGAFGKSSESTRDADWYGTRDYAEAVSQFENGLPETAERMKQSLGAFKAQSNITANKCRPKNHYYGYAPNVAAAIIGLPKSMRMVERIPQKTKTIGILMDCTQNCSVKAADLQKAGETILQLVYALEVREYRVRLDCTPFTARDDNSRKFLCIINLKQFGQSLDILKLSFPVTSPSMFRRFGFRWAETLPGVTGHVSGYGSHMNKSATIDALKSAGYDTASSYVIDVDSCKSVGFDPLKLAKSLGIII